jgi:hypothetical protein
VGEKMKKVNWLLIMFFVCLFSTTLFFFRTQAKYIKKVSYPIQITTKAPEARTTILGYTGGAQAFTAEESGYYVIQIWGGDGGNSSVGYSGGRGANIIGMLALDTQETLEVIVGGRGVDGVNNVGGNGGYNGGGNGGNPGWFSSKTGGGGGGATDIRMNEARIMVAGGGGGGASGNSDGSATAGGAGGSTDFINILSGSYSAGSSGAGESGIFGGRYAGGGGTNVGGIAYKGNASDSSDAKDAEGAAGSNGGNWCGGGGGGFYGGAGGSSTNSYAGGGGGGSSFLADGITNNLSSEILALLPDNTSTAPAYMEGYGYVIITYVGVNLPSD